MKQIVPALAQIITQQRTKSPRKRAS